VVVCALCKAPSKVAQEIHAIVIIIIIIIIINKTKSGQLILS